MQGFIQHLADALSLGSLFALTALGISLLFGIMRLVNFAHGDLITIGAYALIVPSSNPNAVMFIGLWPVLDTIIAICAIVVALAILCERLAFKPMRGANPSVLMIASFAVSYFLQNALIMIYGSRPKGVNLWPALAQSVSVGGVRLQLLQIVTIVTTLVLLCGLTLFLRRSAIGRQMRAASENFMMARFLGVRANLVIAAAFAISGFFAAVVSLLYVVQRGTITYDFGVPLVMAAFVATVIGGMGSVLGAVLGGFLVGFANVFFQVVLPMSLRGDRDAFVYGFVILVLLVRPAGLIKVKSVQERV
ncbi:branched-chain amino acid ABC transporter permease [Acidisoma cellulosilytica]|uniref:Branched-chain amino acid ABC transporter permease n=1 Tax=Acidisoma cellulosilyticum TaxID=2802395 RepID=A0A963Z284_9PROT|nr:branched-chain amino acid ABC transporter permease [Acidisoma cellulosilyticum]MCB8881425.1 branched-chain amino acid ABC transporter permease [Acidisoma cellulosilyticum]